MRRNFTYVDDIVTGTLACLETPPSEDEKNRGLFHRLYNIGNNRSESLMSYIHVLESALDKKAKIHFEPLQPGDVKDTIADITATQRDFGFQPKTNIEEGLKAFATWFKDYYGYASSSSTSASVG
jgi:UDP-glucuronate 4-epimerase